MMKAIVVEEPGGPEVLRIREIPRPTAEPGTVLIRIRAFGLNRSEMFTRQGHSPGVNFPRVLGIECVGEVVQDPSGRLRPGQKVATMMGEMGRAYDGGYAEYTRVPAGQVLPLRTNLAWDKMAAIPEMFQTAHGSLKYALKVEAGKTLLIRGGTSSVGMTAATLGRWYGLKVVATTRNAAREARLMENGADQVVVDTGNIAPEVLKLFPAGVDYVLDLIGTKTLNDSLAALAPGGIACMTGILGNSWHLNEWNPMEHIKNGTYLTVYAGEGISAEDLQELVDAAEQEKIRLNIDRVFRFEEIVEAHQYMESNQAMGKLVVVVA